MSFPTYAIPGGIQRWAIILSALGGAASLAFCVRTAVARRSALPIYLFLGGALRGPEQLAAEIARFVRP